MGSSDPTELALCHDADVSRLTPALADRFVHLQRDAALDSFLESVLGRPPGIFTSIAHSLLLRTMSDFDANALCGMYPMYLGSTEQWQRLLGTGADRRLLDVGAGSGDVTVRLAPLFGAVQTTEVSLCMSWRLRRRGFSCARCDVARDHIPAAPYDVITCLNVLDRCAYPLTLLERAARALKPDGQLCLALALPYSPFVYDGPRSLDPLERLSCTSEVWEDAVVELVNGTLEPLGFDVEVLSRLPYLSGGDRRSAIYELDDAILICRAR